MRPVVTGVSCNSDNLILDDNRSLGFVTFHIGKSMPYFFNIQDFELL